MFRCLAAVWLCCCIVVPASAELTVWPTKPTMGAAVVVAEVPGRWAVLSATPTANDCDIAAVEPSVYELKSGASLCVFQGLAGKYVVIFTPHDVTLKKETATIQIGTGGDGDEDGDEDEDEDEDPPPEPGARLVCLVYSLSEGPPAPPLLQQVQSYCRSADPPHDYELVWPTAYEGGQQTPAWFKRVLAKLRESGIEPPAVVVSTVRGDRVLAAAKMPATGSDIIELIQKNGG